MLFGEVEMLVLPISKGQGVHHNNTDIQQTVKLTIKLKARWCNWLSFESWLTSVFHLLRTCSDSQSNKHDQQKCSIPPPLGLHH